MTATTIGGRRPISYLQRDKIARTFTCNMDESHLGRHRILSIDDIINTNDNHVTYVEPEAPIAASCCKLKCSRIVSAQGPPTFTTQGAFHQAVCRGDFRDQNTHYTFESEAMKEERHPYHNQLDRQFCLIRPSLCQIPCTSCHFCLGYRTGVRPEYIQKRRIRASFSHEQVLTLQSMFNRHRYLRSDQRMELASRLGMTEQQVKIWFQNRRYKEKRLQRAEMDNMLNERFIPYH